MITDNQKDQFITRILRDTLSQNIRWSVTTPPSALSHATEHFIPLYIETIFREKRVGIYEYRFKCYTGHNEFYWRKTLGICIVHNPDIVVWQAQEYSPALQELFQLAREQAAGLDDLLNIQSK